MKTSLAIILSGLLIALAIGLPYRWQIAGTGSAIYRLDRWTGRVAECRPPSTVAYSDVVEEWRYKCTIEYGHQ
jgi:hypothetical protein